jgi:hypothetical protein
MGFPPEESWKSAVGRSDQAPHRPAHPLLRGMGHALGVLYILVTLVFGPIQWLATWLDQQHIIQRYERGVARFPPVAGLAMSLLSLGLLELSKIAVLLSYRSFGLWVAVGVTLCAKASLGYFAHITWHAARPKVIVAYPWAARVDAWVGVQLAQLRGFRDRWVGYLKSRSWYPDAVNAITRLWKRAAHWVGEIKSRLTTRFG